jgi:hypothetical protein
MVGMVLLIQHHMQQRTAVALQHAADQVHDNCTAKSKMYSWNEWLAWLCLSSNAHAAAALHHSARSRLCAMITVQPQSKMHGWNEWLVAGSVC